VRFDRSRLVSSFVQNDRGYLRQDEFGNEILSAVVASQKLNSMAISFDLLAPTFCQDADNKHKADRVEMPEDFTIDTQNLYLYIESVAAKSFI
jgi:hypothetical protein